MNGTPVSLHVKCSCLQKCKTSLHEIFIEPLARLTQAIFQVNAFESKKKKISARNQR